MEHRERRRGDTRGAEIVGILLIVAGGYWLLAQTGFFFWLGWGFLWPLVLVGLGVLLVMSRTGSISGSGVDMVSIPREDLGQLELNIAMGGGRLALEGGSTGLVEAHSTLADLHSEVRRSGDAMLVRLRGDHFGRGAWWGGIDWQVRAASDVPIDLRVTAGAGDFSVDLSSIRILRATLSIGAASTRLVLPRPAGDVEVRISTGAASVALVVPPGVESRVLTTGGLISVDGTTETAGYATATDRVSVLVTGGASSVRIR